MQATELKLPHLVTTLPGPKAKRLVEEAHSILSPSYTRDYPLVAKVGRGATIEDVDGNTFLDFAAGIAYLARWAFDSEIAFFSVLAFDAIVAIVVYRVALDSAVESAQRLKESMIAALSSGDGPIAN